MTQTVIPQVRITDAGRSLAFYVDGLGFAVDWEHRFEPGLPLFVQLTRERQTIFLTQHSGDCQVGGAVYFKVPDVDACCRDFRARGIVSTQGPEDTAWGTREMVVTDPDGNRLRFATHAPVEVHPPSKEASPLAVLLRCNDIVETRSFYGDVLGFEVSDTAEGTLTAKGPGGARLIFTTLDPWHSPPRCSGTFYFTVDDVDGLCAAVQGKAALAWGLQDMPYGSREFGIKDCNGYALAFQQKR